MCQLIQHNLIFHFLTFPVKPFVFDPKMNTRKEPFKCGVRPSSLPSSLRYDAASCFDAARSAETRKKTWPPIARSSFFKGSACGRPPLGNPAVRWNWVWPSTDIRGNPISPAIRLLKFKNGFGPFITAPDERQLTPIARQSPREWEFPSPENLPAFAGRVRPAA